MENEPTGNNLKLIRIGKNLKGPEIANTLGITPQYYYELERGDKRLNETLLHKLADFLGVSTDHILGRKGTTVFKKIPILGAIRAGIPLLTYDNWEGEIDIPPEVNADFALRVTGDSMSWVGIHEGDIALLRQIQNPYHGMIVAAGVEDGTWEATLKYYIEKNGTKLLRAANPHYEDIIIGPKHRIIGYVVKLIKEPPAINNYETILFPKNLADNNWQETIEYSTGIGLDGESVKNILEGFARLKGK